MTARSRFRKLRVRGRRLVSRAARVPTMGETQRFLLLSVVIGIFAGLVVVCFHIAIEFFLWNTVHAMPHPPWWAVVLWPAVGAGVAYALVVNVFPASKGSGVNSTKAALYASDGYVPFSAVTGKFVGSTLSIGSGNPMGPEDPALQMGAGIASLLGRMFHLTRDRMRLIAPVGAAAGIGAAFNTPITAVLFVMEEVVAAWSSGVLGSIVLAAVSAVVVSRWFLGDDPLYSVPEFALTDYTELLVYASIGVVGGLLSAWFTVFVVNTRARLSRRSDRFRAALPIAAGLLVGAVGVKIPQILGAGYEAIDSALHDRFPWEYLLILGALKMVTTALCFAAATPGGMFAPTLFIGAMIGGGIGGLAHQYLPFETSPASAYVLVGIGTFFAGLFRAPMTSVFMVFEVSASYVIILPVMVANTIAFFISRGLVHESLFHTTGKQDGLDLPSVEEQRETLPLSVEDALRETGENRVVPSTMRVDDALERTRDLSVPGCLVSVHDRGWFWAKRSDIQAALEKGQGDKPLLRAVSLKPAVQLYPDLSLDSALRLLASFPVLPVVSRVNTKRLIGSLTLDDVHRAYGVAPVEPEPAPKA